MLKELKNRHSPLLFKKKAISKKKIEKCLEAARWAPSCSNNQPWKFILIEGPRRIRRFAEAFPRGNQWCLEAPMIGFIVSKNDLDCVTEDNQNLAYFQYDCGMAMMSFVTQAMAEGMQCHQMAGYNEKVAKKLLKAPRNHRVIVAFAMGYEEKLKDHKGELHPRLVAKIKGNKRTRKPLKEVYSMNKF